MLKLRFKARRSAAGPQDVSLLLSFFVFAISSQRVVQGGWGRYVCSRNSVYSNSGIETFRKAIGTKRKQKMKRIALPAQHSMKMRTPTIPYQLISAYRVFSDGESRVVL